MLNETPVTKEFLYLFNTVEFDKNGNVCKTNTYSENEAKANYIYLISKYNQKLLKEGEKFDDFFKTDLQNVLGDVKNGGDFEKAKKTVLAHCKEERILEFKRAKNDKDFIQMLNEKTTTQETSFAAKFQTATNNLHLSYMITSITGNMFNDILKLGDEDVKSRSIKYKKIIEYNALTLIADKLAKNELTKDDVCKTIC